MKQTLDRLTPETERLPYWDGVLQDARPSRARWAAPRLAIVGAVVALAALIAIAPWKESERTGVLDRALAAVGDGPITHVIVRSEIEGRMVDLESDSSRPLYDERELWWHPEQGTHTVSKFDGAIYGNHVGDQPPDPILLGFTEGYRQALESGQARVVRQGTFRGREASWIRFRYGEAPGTSGIEIAVDKESGEPLYLQAIQEGRLLAGNAWIVVDAETVDDHDFTAAKDRGPGPGRSILTGRDPRQPIAPEEAARSLGAQPVWLGETHGALPLVAVYGQRIVVVEAGSETRARGLELLYGEGARTPFAPGVAPWVRVTMYTSRQTHLPFGWFRIRKGPPEGSIALYGGMEQVAMGESGSTVTAGYIRAGGLYVTIDSSSEDLVLSAARALRPLSAGSGAGG